MGFENLDWTSFDFDSLILVWFDLFTHQLSICTFELIYKTYNNEGRVYTYLTGLKQHLYINHPEMVKELTQTNTLNLGRITHVTKRLEPILGNGVITSDGPHLAHQRRIMTHEFTHDKIEVLLLSSFFLINVYSVTFWIKNVYFFKCKICCCDW